MKNVRFKLFAFTFLSLAYTAVLAKNKWSDVNVASATEADNDVAEWVCQLMPCCW